MKIVKYLVISTLAAAPTLFPNGAIGMDDSKESAYPKISGRAVEWLHDPAEDIYVKILLNDQDAEAIKDNNGRGIPVMLSGVKRTDKVTDEHTPHVALLEEGSHIAFQIKVNNPGECGFGFSIATDHETIVEKLYLTDTEGRNDVLLGNIRRYQDKEKTIKVDLFKTLGLDKINPDKRNEYMYCTINCWEIESFEKKGLRYPRPQTQNSNVVAGIKGGAVHEGCLSNAKFSTINNVKDGSDIGSLRIAFYLFANKKEREAFYSAYRDIQCDDF